MRVAVGSDHAGRPLRHLVAETLTAAGHEPVLVGPDHDGPVDYPDVARAVGQAIQRATAPRGVVVCGSGAGVTVAANKIAGVRAALAHDSYTARQMVEHDHVNVLALGALVVGPSVAADAVRAFASASFSGEARHRRRLAQVLQLESEHHMNGLTQLHDAGQSVWLDSLRRGLITSGELARHITENAVTGVTTNPTILERAITGSVDYDDAIGPQSRTADETPEELVFALALDDVRAAADLLRPVFDATDGADGYVSIEVAPRLAHDAAGTVKAGRRLFADADRPNVMIKVPGTPAGVEATEALLNAGVPVNVTLLFSTAQWEAAAEAHLRAQERRLADGLPLRVASVASVFVSRWDAAVAGAVPEALANRLGVAVSQLTYAAYRQLLASARWQRLAEAGALPQRVLWASTGTKDPKLPDTYYLTALAAPDTVATIPEPTLLAFAEHGKVVDLLATDTAPADALIDDMRSHGVDEDELAARLQAEGLHAFTSSFAALVDCVQGRSDSRRAVRAQTGERPGGLAAEVDAVVAGLAARDGVRRIWSRDHTLWQEDPAEVADRLGWLVSPQEMEDRLAELERFTKEAVADGLTHAVVCGMGGSSLFPEVLVRTFGPAPGALEVRILDTTDPAAIARLEAEVPLDRTLFVAASKSGTTLETRAHLEHFWERIGDGRQFVAITDAGTPLAELARERDFRRVFENRPDVGGRYSALTHFGLVPGALLGVDLAQLLERAGRLAAALAPCVPPDRNPGLRLGATIGAAAREGRDKLTLVLPEELSSFGAWVEQLIAESTGKRGTGIVPVVGEPLGPPDSYGEDRLFVAVDDHAGLDELAAAGHPVVRLPYDDRFDLGAEVLRWEFAAAVAGAVLAINPFDQPDVAAAKAATDAVLDAGLPDVREGRLAAALAQLGAGDYLAIQAYVDPGADVVEGLQAARVVLRDRHRVATTLGIGPRFLHSTGQLHKGGPPSGVFVQVVGEDPGDVPIPGKPYGFSTLKRAQAAGDLRSLRDRRRRATRVALDELLEVAR